MTVKVDGINHVVLHVGELERSKRFYMDLLGFEMRNEFASAERKMLFLRCGMQGLDLFEVAGDVHGGEEMNHMALNVAEATLDDLVSQLSAMGIDASRRTPRNSVFIVDPDGHRIELLPLEAHERQREREISTTSA